MSALLPEDDPRLQEDTAARQRALAVESFIVQAPAGAGKTELLTQRTLRLLAVVEQPEEVLAITFTNKAAAEMRLRILGSLERAAGGVAPTEPHKRLTFDLARDVLARDAALAWGLLEHPGRLRIATIDALCLGLARQMPYLSRFGGQPGITDAADAHYRQAARQTFALLEEGGPTAEWVGAALAFVDNDAARLENLLVGMLARRDQWLRHLGRMQGEDFRAEVEAGFARLYAEVLRAAADVLTGYWQDRLMPLARLAAERLPETLGALRDWNTPLGSGPDDLARWQAVARLLLTSSGGLRKSFDKRIGFPAEDKPAKAAMTELAGELLAVSGLETALNGVLELPAAKIADAEWSTVEAFVGLLRLATAQLWLVFQAAGEVDFIEIALRALEALGEDEAPTDLAQALDYRIAHLLVDEFQDTSPLQVALLARLMRGWQPGDGRTLFVVGDPMQSIYRFRKADVGTFLNVRARGVGDVPLQTLRLCRNNRSHPAIVDWVNDAFARIFPSADAPSTGAVRYAESVATKGAVEASGVQFHPLVVPEGEDGEAAEARRVLDLILAERAADPQARIAVLVRARSHLDGLVAEIRRRQPDLRFQAVEIEGLLGRQHVQDVLALQYALWHRADRVHWLAVLRAPWCGLTLADLHALAGDAPRQTIWQLLGDEARVARLSADGQARLQPLRAVLKTALAERGRMPARRWLEGVWHLLGGPRCLSAAAELADLEALFGLVEALEASGRLDAATLADEAAALYAPPDAAADETLQMMTIHKSKGLEFETVIVPGLARGAGGADPSLLLWDEVAEDDGLAHLLVAPMRRRGEDGGPTAHDFLRRIEQRRSAHEDARLLYVAATRAIRSLHLVGVGTRAAAEGDSRGEVRAPRAGTFLELLWPVGASLAWNEAPDAELPARRAIDPTRFVARLRRLREIVPIGQDWAPALAEARPRPAAAADEDLPAFSLDISVGTLVHRCLELMVKQGLAAWPAEGLDARQPGFMRWLQGQGHAPAEAEEGARRAVSALRTTLASDSGRWVLAAHAEAGAEQAWSSREADLTVNHVIDRIFVADGVRWIVDYKTVNLPPDAPEAALRAKAEGYRAQLERYAGLFAGDALPLRLAIFFPVQGRLLTLD